MAWNDAIKWTAEMDQAIISNQTTFIKLAEEWGIGRSCISRRAEKLCGRKASEWPLEDIETLKKEWDRGTPAAQIGQMINKTKNSVIGKAHRLRLAARRASSPIKNANVIKIKVAKFIKARRAKAALTPMDKLEKITKKKDKKAPIFYPAAVPLTDRAPISIMELNENTCRAPVGRAPNGLVTYCGDEVFPDKSFCPGHCALYYRPQDTRRRA